jgi:hypothetical protein
MNVAIFWDIAGAQPPAARWFLARLIFDPEDGGDAAFRNVGSHTDCTALHPRRWQYSKHVLQL